jgi:histidine triad (HIT) family protein
MGCIFCEIVEKKRPAKIIYEDELACFRGYNPQAPVHALVVTKTYSQALI